jgi:hypothetical protein
MDDLIASAPHTTAVGNMRVNAQGDILGTGGEVIQTREQRTRAYYKNHPQASNQKVSLKGKMNDTFEKGGSADFAGLKPDTAKTAAEDDRVQQELNNEFMTETPVEEQVVPEVAEPVAEEPEEFEAEMPPTDPEEFEVEPDGYEEVHLPNGDIEMKPYWNTPDES